MGYITTSPGVQLFYEIRPTTSSDRRPWLLFLHPTTCDTSLAAHFWQHEDFAARFNVIAFDQRHHGRTKAIPNSACDVWTLAADVAIAMHKLRLPPVHVFTGQSWPSEIAVRLAMLFPERVLSLGLCGIGPQSDTPFLKNAFTETIQTWSNPDTPEDWDEAISCTGYWLFGDDWRYVPDLYDRWAAAIVRRYPPFKALDAFAFASTFISRLPAPAECSTMVKAPMLLLQGDLDTVYTPDEAQSRVSEFTAIPGGPTVHIIEGGSSVPLYTHTEILREAYLNWIDPLLSSTPASAYSPCASVFRKSLQQLAQIADDPSIAERDATQSNSFSAAPEALRAELSGFMQALAGLQTQKFGLVGGGAKESWDGASFAEEVPWRFSERFDDARYSAPSTALSTPTTSVSCIEGVTSSEKTFEFLSEFDERYETEERCGTPDTISPQMWTLSVSS